MKRTDIYTDKAVDRRYQFTPAIVHQRSGLLFISGVCGWDQDGKILFPENPGKQARAAFENLRDILNRAGASFKDIIWSTEYVTDIRQYREIALVRSEYFPDNFPTATLVEVTKLFKPGQIFEIQTIAAME
ncbi:MAG: RidA family protein [Rhizobiaceae bacterium]|jgi:enamine deaminase RidA (YjgF/YER057c/UK114 family)|nr:MAG: RidA family protein [Rhizobiaceae bacterium]